MGKKKCLFICLDVESAEVIKIGSTCCERTRTGGSKSIERRAAVTFLVLRFPRRTKPGALFARAVRFTRRYTPVASTSNYSTRTNFRMQNHCCWNCMTTLPAAVYVDRLPWLVWKSGL